MERDYIEFQDRSVAVAYMITFRCYGTWLHGDERGSVDRRFFNRYGSEMIRSDPKMRSMKIRMLKSAAFILGRRERAVVEKAIREVCRVRGYSLIAINVRSNHVHIVVGNGGQPERIMDAFKAYATRALRAERLIGDTVRPWSRHGSTRYLWCDEHVDLAVEYVNNGQGEELPEFE